jgi:hypothetical protein
MAGSAGRLAFFLVELDARLGWRLGRRARFDTADPGGPYTSLVAYLPEPLAAELADVAAALRGGEQHFRYPPDQLHVTVRSFGDATRLPSLGPALDGLPPIVLTAAGLGFTRDTVQLRLLPENSSLGEARRRLARTHGIPPRQPRQRLLGPVAFANILRLNGRVAPELREEVAGLRRLMAGERIVLPELTLVRTDKVATPERTQVLERYTLS